MEANTSCIRNGIDAHLTVALLAARRLALGDDESVLFHFRHQRVEPSITEARVGTDHIVDNLGDQVAMRGPVHQLCQYDEFVQLYLFSSYHHQVYPAVIYHCGIV